MAGTCEEPDAVILPWSNCLSLCFAPGPLWLAVSLRIAIFAGIAVAPGERPPASIMLRYS